MTKQEAISKVKEFVDLIGPGYHPDNLMSDYVDTSGKRSFTDAEATKLQAEHDSAWQQLGDEIYTIALDYTTERFT